MATIGMATVTLDLMPPHRVVIISLVPDDPIVVKFCDEFKAAMGDPNIIAAELPCRSWSDLCKAAERVRANRDHSCVVLVTHGGSDHVIDIQDQELAKATAEIQEAFQHMGPLSSLFPDLFDDKMVFLAFCYGGHEQNVVHLQRTAMALHVVAPSTGRPKLSAVDGAKAMAAFIREIHPHNQRLSPDHLAYMFTVSQANHPGVLEFWRYAGSTPKPQS